MTGAAAGLGALGFWIFIAAVVVGGIWYDIRRRESQQETLRRVVESGQDLDAVTIDRLLAKGDSKSLERDLKISALIVIAIAPGLAILGWFLSQLSEQLLSLMIGVSLLVACVAVGLYMAAKLVERRYSNDPG